MRTAMSNETKETGSSFMEKLSTVIVDKRNLIFLLTIILLVFSAFSRNWVEVESDLTYYLPSDSETKQALDIMDEQFTTYGTAEVMVANITPEQAAALEPKIKEIKGVQSVDYDETTAHYNNLSALYSITFAYSEDDEACLDSLEAVKEYLSDYDLYVDTDLGNTQQETIDHEISVIMVYVAIVIVIVLLFTSETYGEVPVLILTFVVALVLNQGTNFLMGKISFISNSVTSILQLALSIDYAIIFCHRYMEERDNGLDAREADIAALSKAIIEISSSSLTTISGLVALMLMQLRIGFDMGIVLTKGIIFSMLCVFLLMPGLLMLFGPYMSKTKHRNFVPKISFVGRYAYKTRKIVPIVFAVVLVFAYHFQTQCPYAYGYGPIKTPVLNETQIADNMIDENFTKSNLVALVVPKNDDYRVEAAMIKELESHDEVDHTRGLSNIEAMDGYMLTDALTPRQLSELANLDYEIAKALYGAYAVEHDEYGEIINGLSDYKVPLYDMFMFLKQEMEDGNITLGGDVQDTLDDLFAQLDKAQVQLQSDKYSRLVAYLNVPEESDETFAFVDKIHDIVGKYYDSDYYVVGNTTSAMDLSSSFGQDNLLISVLSALFVILVLLFTFKSAGLPVLLIIVIQGSIWINFAFPYLQHSQLYFLGYLIVNSIQMGANIDYAIVISSHYTDLKKVMHHKEAIVAALNESFPTIFTSGSILASAGVLISVLTTNPVIAAIGECLGRGTIISIILVLFVLPQILVLGDSIIERTSFEMKGIGVTTRTASGTMHVNGRVRGYINGVVDAEIKGVLHGQFNASISTGTEVTVDEPDMYLPEGDVTATDESPNEPADTTKGGDAE